VHMRDKTIIINKVEIVTDSQHNTMYYI